MSVFRKFLRAEDGAITVDWVVLTAGIATLGAVVAITVGSQAKSNADNIAVVVDTIQVGN